MEDLKKLKVKILYISNPVTCSYSAGHDNQDRESTYNQSLDIWKGKCGV